MGHEWKDRIVIHPEINDIPFFRPAFVSDGDFRMKQN